VALLPRQKVDEDGLVATYDAATGGGDSFENDGRVILHAKNASVSPITVTVAAEQATTQKPGFGELTKADAAVAVPADGEAFLGPFPTIAFGVLGQITYSDVTTLTIAALRV
jgi:hypothetical protein